MWQNKVMLTIKLIDNEENYISTKFDSIVIQLDFGCTEQSLFLYVEAVQS
jgi:hypothetical protein